MDEDNENKQPQIILGGVSGNKELRVRRVHKKKNDGDTNAAAEQDSEAVQRNSETQKVPATVKAEAFAPSDAPVKTKSVSEDRAETPKRSHHDSDSAGAAENNPRSASATGTDVQGQRAVNRSAGSDSVSGTTGASEIKKPVIPDKRKISSAVVAMPETVRSSTIIQNGRTDRRPYSGRTEGQQRTGGYQGQNRNNGSQGRPGERTDGRYPRSDYGDRRPAGGGYSNGSRPQGAGGYGGGQRQGGYGGQRQGGGYGGGGFAKDKDEEYSSRAPQKRTAVKSKTDSPVEEVKKVRANFAERNAIEKKRSDSKDTSKKDTSRTAVSTDRRSKSKSVVNTFAGRGSEVLSDETAYDPFGAYGSRRRKKTKTYMQPVKAIEKKITDIQLPPFITVKEFAEGIEKKSSDVIKELMKLGTLATINQELDFDTACLLADAFGIKAEPITEVSEEDILFDDTDDAEENLKPRPPVVVVMGHVDHGKTSLLDKIRSASVVSGEAGGITQHIGAYTVRLKGRQITFLDTPGHEAFTTMRARGAQVTDIAILVVAADDGVMPQTIEAIHHAKAAGTEIIVAINKMDKPGANPDKVKQELSNYELIPEEWGGSTIMVPVSAKKGEGIDDLLEMVLLTADVLQLKADPKRQAKGTVIEAKLDKNRGPVATVLVQRGTLHAGDTVVCGPMVGNVRAMYDDKGADLKKAGPSVPAEVLGLPEVPEAGEIFYAVTDDKMARQLVEKRRIKQREDQLRKSSRMSLETLSANLAAGDIKDLNIIIKADVQGSVEAVTQSLGKLNNEEVRVRVIHGGVGAINESDVVLADVTDAIIIGFNVRPNAVITEKAKEAGVDIRLYSVIYNAIDDIQAAMKGMLAPKFEEAVIGHVEIREIFKVSGVGTIGGAYVLDGKIARNCDVRVVRDGVVLHTGHLASLQRMKDAVKEVNAGYECGLSIENYNDIKIGDEIEAYEMKQIER